jgi:two-component system, OmpR family, response regulator VicR
MTHASKKILVIEDEKPLARALQLKLQKEGYEVTIAYDGQAAIKLLTESDSHYRAVLLDLMMPVMNGFQLLENLHEMKIKLPPVFVLSNLTQPEDERRVVALGAKKLLIKSDTPLSQIVDELKQL